MATIHGARGTSGQTWGRARRLQDTRDLLAGSSLPILHPFPTSWCDEGSSGLGGEFLAELPGGVVVDEVHERLHRFHRGRRQDAVPQVEYVTFAARDALQDVARALLDDFPGSEQRRRVEVALQR